VQRYEIIVNYELQIVNYFVPLQTKYGKSAEFACFGVTTATVVAPDGVCGREGDLPQADRGDGAAAEGETW
jgi:hypothetical protein